MKPWERYKRKPWEKYQPTEQPVEQPVAPAVQNDDPYEDDFYTSADPVMSIWNALTQTKFKDTGEGRLPTAIANIPSSYSGVDQALSHAVTNPVETAETLGKTLLGTGQKIAPDTLGAGQGLLGEDYTQYPDALYQHYSNIANNPGKAFTEDPIGTGLDVYGPTRAAVGASKAGVKLGAKALPDTWPAATYQRGAKFSGAGMTPEKTRAVSETAMKNRILTTEAGAEKLQGKLANFSKGMDDLIDGASKEGKTVRIDSFYSEVDKLKEALGGPKLFGGDDIKEINRTVNNFKDHVFENLGQIEYITPRQALEFKRDLYARINWTRSNLTPTGEQIMRHFANKSKKEIEGLDPKIKKLNEEWAPLLALDEYLPKATVRIGNKDPFGLGDLAFMSAGAAAAGPVGGAIGGAASAGKRSVNMQRLGTSLYGLQNNPMPKPLPRDIIMGMLQSGNIQGLLGE